MKGTMIQRSKGSWTVIFDTGRDASGRRKQKWKTIRGTKADAERELRRVPMTVSAPRSHRTEQKKTRLALGPAYIDHDLVRGRADGRPINPPQLSKDFLSMLRRSEGLPRVRFHDLRHTHATQLLRQGVHPKIVSERLGHATIVITLDLLARDSWHAGGSRTSGCDECTKREHLAGSVGVVLAKRR